MTGGPDKGGALPNLLGIADPAKLRIVEQDAASWRMAMLAKDPIPGRFDLDHLQAIHKAIFQDVYPWAGELRSVDIRKGQSSFTPVLAIAPNADKLFAELASENHLKGLFTDRFVERTAHFLTEVNRLHPFREGNGRTQQVFFEQLSREAGKPLDFSNISRTAMNFGATMAHNKGSAFFKTVVESALKAGRATEPDRDR